MLVGYLITEFLIYGVVSTSSRVVIQSQERHEIGLTRSDTTRRTHDV